MPATTNLTEMVERAENVRNGYIAFALGDDWSEDLLKVAFAAKIFGIKDREVMFAAERKLLASTAPRVYGPSCVWKQAIVSAHLDFLCCTQDDVVDL